VNRFGKIIFCLAFFAALFAVDLRAEPVAATVESEVVADHNAAEPLVSMSAPTLFHLLGLPVTNSMICTWIVAALILVIVRVTVRRRGN